MPCMSIYFVEEACQVIIPSMLEVSKNFTCFTKISIHDGHDGSDCTFTKADIKHELYFGKANSMLLPILNLALAT